jgi:hypothetical protein
MTAHKPARLFAAWALLLVLAGCAPLSKTPAQPPGPVYGTVDSLQSGSDAPVAPTDEAGAGATVTAPPVQTQESSLPAMVPSLSGDNNPAPRPPGVWGIAGIRAFAFDQQVAPNGFDYNALFSFDTNFNLWLWQAAGFYAFNDTTFWGQRAAPGITNAAQGAFDFSKREFDMSSGLAWDFYGPFEARAFAYSFNNLNRGSSPTQPGGYADGAGLEGRCYLGPTPQMAGYDVAHTPYVGAGYYLSKDLVDPDGNRFSPGPFVRARLTVDLLGPQFYAYADAQLVATKSFTLELLTADFGLAARPWVQAPQWEVRIGSSAAYDIQSRELGPSLYGQLRYLY